MFKRFDGSGREPRPTQKILLDWLTENWEKTNVFAINAPTGVGKSAILRAIQLQFPGSVGIVPSNVLMDQYIETYPDVNYLRGMAHYSCGTEGMTCADKNLLKMKHEADCLYRKSKNAAYDGESTIFNPVSYFYYAKSERYEAPEVLIIDEAHKLSEVLMLLTGYEFRKSRYNYPDIKDDHQLLAWIKDITNIYYSLMESQSGKDKVNTARRIERLKFLIKTFEATPEQFVFYKETVLINGKEDEYLYVKPIKPSKWLLDSILASHKVILLSATLLESDVWGLGLSNYQYLDVPSPVDKSRREVKYWPNTVKMNYQTPPVQVAEYINGILDKHPGLNTVIHVSYSWAEKLKEFFPTALFNTPETKQEALKQFKEKGGVWIASGCSEGIDLPGDECRLVIIPLLLFGNPSDPVTEKRLGLPRGRLLYDLDVLKLVIQQAGRGTRSSDDYSLTVVGDSRFPWLVNKNRSSLPKSFLEAIKWNV